MTKPLLILALFVFITYINSLNNVFLSDDLPEIVHKSEIASFSNVYSDPFGFVKPFLYWSAYHLGGLNPLFFRIFNIIFHLGNVWLLFLITSLLYNRRVAFFASALLAVHPALVEPIVWISGGGYVHYGFFFLLSFYFYALSKKKWAYLGAVFSFILSLESHPVMPVALPLVFVLYEYLFGDLKKNFKKLLIFFLISSAWVYYDLSGLPKREETLEKVHYQQKGVDNIFQLLPSSISSYAQLLFFPKTLTLYHSELAFGAVSFIIRAIFTLLFFISIIFAFFKKQKTYFFWASFSLIALAPTLTPYRLNWIVAERYIYLPSIGIFILVGLGLDKLIQFKRKYTSIILAVFAIIILLLFARSFLRNIDWKTEDNLWIATGKTSPSSPNTHNNLGDVYGRQGDKQRALMEFQRAIELKPNYGDAYHNLGNTYRELGDFDKALANYQMAARLNPNLWQSYQNIAALYFQSKQYDKALENIQKAISINPKNINLYLNLGVVYLSQGDKVKAKQIFTQILSSDPQNQMAQAGFAEANK